jgi:hypothetical protein
VSIRLINGTIGEGGRISGAKSNERVPVCLARQFIWKLALYHSTWAEEHERYGTHDNGCSIRQGDLFCRRLEYELTVLRESSLEASMGT